MNNLKQQFIEKSHINILDLFVENPKGEFQYKGKWYSSKFGCDLIDHLVDTSDSTLSECWDMAGEEEKNNIAEKYGDFRIVRKWGLGLVKYGRALRFFLLPHTKHKEGDDDTQF